MVAAQVQPPPAADWQVAMSRPSPVSGDSIPEQFVVVPEIIKHPAGRSNWTLPVVVVPSVYVPFELAVHVPLTVREPLAVTFLQLRGSRPASEMSTFELDTVRHDDITVQVPTTLPPQADPLAEHAADVPPVPLPVVPPVVPAVPAAELPPVPVGPSELDVHAPKITPNAIAIARTAADWPFIEALLAWGWTTG
jgi:hypothetical protein